MHQSTYIHLPLYPTPKGEIILPMKNSSTPTLVEEVDQHNILMLIQISGMTKSPPIAKQMKGPVIIEGSIGTPPDKIDWHNSWAMYRIN